MACFALHNWLLAVDGLDEHWESGVRSDWEGDLGFNSHNDLLWHQSPFAIQKMHREHDTSGMGRGDDADNEIEDVNISDDLNNLYDETEDNVIFFESLA